MTGKERFYAAAARQKVDRPPVWMSAPVGQELKNMCQYYGVKDWHELQVKAGDDVYAFDIPYDSGYATSIAAAFDSAGVVAVADGADVAGKYVVVIPHDAAGSAAASDIAGVVTVAD